jgi:hypothetical protein
VADWEIGDKVIHPYNAELGVGVIQALKGRRMTVYFKDVSDWLTKILLGAGLSQASNLTTSLTTLARYAGPVFGDARRSSHRGRTHRSPTRALKPPP